jgi:hypothetical protein
VLWRSNSRGDAGVGGCSRGFAGRPAAGIMTSTLQAKTYAVRPGDNLDAIARANGYRDWSEIYRSRCNRQLQRLRPDPNLIRPGDLVMLPPRGGDVYVMLQRQLERLRAVRRDATSLFDGVQGGLDAEFSKVESVGSSVDAVNDVLNILRSLSKLCWTGYKTLEMGSEELARANQELAHEALDLPKDQFETLIMKAFADQGDQARAASELHSYSVVPSRCDRSLFLISVTNPVTALMSRSGRSTWMT